MEQPLILERPPSSNGDDNNRKSVAGDVLRAAGVHLTLEPLNAPPAKGLILPSPPNVIQAT